MPDDQAPTPPGVQAPAGDDDQRPPDQSADAPSANDPAAETITSHEALQAQLSDLRAALEQERAASAALRQQLGAATAGYREAALAAHPEVPPDLVSGETPEEIDRSLAAARQTVEAVRRRLVEAAGPPVPAGAPVRTAPDLSGLSAFEKIKAALKS